MKTNASPHEIKFSLFNSPKGIQETNPTTTLSLNEFNEYIYHDDCVKLTIPVRSCTPEEYPGLKSKLPFFTPNGVFSKRGKENIKEFNATLLPIDIDKVGIDKAVVLRNYLGRMDGCIYASVSPSLKGVKALFLLSEALPWDTYTQVLKQNQYTVEEGLGLDCFDVHVDTAQWSRGSCMYLAYDEYKFNPNPKPINLGINLTINQHVNEHVNIDMPVSSIAKSRVCRYIETATMVNVNTILNTERGRRHQAFQYVMKIKSILHYAPHLEGWAKEQLLKACQAIYPEDMPEAFRCFADAWEGAVDWNNETLNKIILDYGKQ